MPIGVLMVGAGEYTVGYVPTAHGAASDKPAGVVALTCFDLRRQGLVGRIVLCDMYGSRMPAVRQTVRAKIADVYKGLDTTLECYPEDHVGEEPTAYLRAMDSMSPGDAVIVFVPDDLHARVAAAALERRLHVLLAKPAVKTLQEHLVLLERANAAGVLAAVEFHKRFDPMYSDARNRIRDLGPFSHFASHMAQPKQQLDTFRAWAGLRSDISYYLNSHHVDLHNWSVRHMARPVTVMAMVATGVAEEKLGRPCEDTVTLLVQWQDRANPQGCLGTAVYTASWVAAKGDCHTQQGFHYMGQRGELRVDQAHRGYGGSTDEGGYGSYNPLYMRYTPDASGRFAGQSGYGYVSIARFLGAAAQLNAGETSMAALGAEGELALLGDTVEVTAILHAGRLSLDTGCLVRIVYGRAPGAGPEGALGGDVGGVAGVGERDGAAGGAGEVHDVPVRLEVVGAPVQSHEEAKV